MSNKVAQEVEKLLSTALGDFIARAAVAKGCKQIGSDADTIAPTQLGALAEKLELSVKALAGPAVAGQLAAKIKGIQAGPTSGV
ncbi:MAG: hypothetical protein HY558_05740 [Euryarchaeota archaeon]|nr:hypothetical protein [Euryarchaeota archaeon]